MIETIDQLNAFIEQKNATLEVEACGRLHDIADELIPDDEEVIDVLGATFGMSRVEVIDRLDRMDLTALREVPA